MGVTRASLIEGRFLSTKVARRIFVWFVVCALVPLSALAYFANDQVSSELRKQADERLRQSCKSIGLGFFERLRFLESDLATVSAHLEIRPNSDVRFVLKDLQSHLDGRLKRLAMIRRGDGEGTTEKGRLTLEDLKPEELQHLRDGKALLLIGAKQRGRSDIQLLRACNAPNLDRGVLAATVDPDYFWATDLIPSAQELVVFRRDGAVLFSTLGQQASRSLVDEVRVKNDRSGQLDCQLGKEAGQANYWTLFVRPQFRDEWVLLTGERNSVVQEPVSSFKATFLKIVLLTFSLVLLLSVSQIRRRLIPISLLHEATRRVAKRHFRHRVDIRTGDEFEALGDSFNEMVESMEDQIKSMATINCIGVALSQEKDLRKLGETILTGARFLANADGAALYLSEEDGALRPWLMQLESDGEEMALEQGESLPLRTEDGRLERGIVVRTVLEDRTIVTPNFRKEREFRRLGDPRLDRIPAGVLRSVLSVPMKNQEGEPLGVLLLLNARDRRTGKIVAFEEDAQRLTESLASQAAVAVSGSRLLDAYKSLFDSLAELIARAIDDKSPYTGEHCRRVPILTMMLAEAACRSSHGAMKEVQLTGEELYELHIAALLHDCGKVVTPVHVVDKATKLEAIFDRVELVAARFELVRKSLQVKGHGDEFSDALNEDEAFVRKCNTGGEFMPPEDQDRIREIAARWTWEDSLGKEHPVLTADEVKHLTIQRGTLSAEEREIINHHVVATINMLEALPYPKSLKNVPHIAGAHHERMDGKGYPLNLTRDQIMVQGRILGVADVFEALTANDRPYKRAKTLSEALHILGKMAEGGHIDPDLFDVFVREKVYLRYAYEHLSPEQVDDVDESQIPGYEADALRPPEPVDMTGV